MSSQVCSVDPGDQSQRATPSHSDIIDAATHLQLIENFTQGIDLIECIDKPGCQSKLREFKEQWPAGGDRVPAQICHSGLCL